jgi:hypothetical protein
MGFRCAARIDAMKGIRAIGMTLLAGMLSVGAQVVAQQRAPGVGGAGARGTTSGYQLTVQVPPDIRKGQSATLILHVWKDGQPAEHVGACMATAPLFVSLEDAIDTTPAGGADLGTGSESTARPACSNAIAGVQSGPGVYAFTWEPDTPGRVNLIFTAGAGKLTVPVDVASAPPNAAILVFFAAFIATVLVTAAILRRHLRPGGAA